jgi:hypothetical protein
VPGLAKAFFGEEYKSLCYARPGIQRSMIEESFNISKSPFLHFRRLQLWTKYFRLTSLFIPFIFSHKKKLLMKTKSPLSIQKQRVS